MTEASQFATPRAKVTFGDGTVVTAELATTPAAQQRGLMFRKSLAEREGMLFVFETSDFRPFWMQNCLIALDIIWVDESSTIVSIGESVPPCKMAGCDPPCASNDCPTYPPRAGTKAKYVVEVQAGFSKAHKLAVGQKIKIEGLK
ncbi:MAG TPA: DUF192 domain-containing protein [Vicinamibacterales bacterium]|nr:DUF192 domain-containing protein [Vicinamibacterales bacterium]